MSKKKKKTIAIYRKKV